MFSSVPVSHFIDFEGQKLELQTGLLAKQATQAVLAKIGQTTVLAAVVVGKEKGGDYFPLQIVYEERLYAAGKIKGSRFVKREGKPTDNAILTGRMIDRSLRSLFSPYLRTEVQVVITVLSLDNVNPPDTLAVLAASAALTLCGFAKKETVPKFDFCSPLEKKLPKNPEIRERAVALIQVKNTQKFISFVKNSTDSDEIYKLGYFLPGGKLENSENSVQASQRETLEELGIDNLEHLGSLGKCEVSLPYNQNISQGVEHYEWFEVEARALENLVKSEKDEQDWEIKLVEIDDLRTNNWPQLNMILDRLEDFMLEKELDLVKKTTLNTNSADLTGETFNQNAESSALFSNSLLNHIQKLENTPIFNGPVSSVRLGLEIENLGIFWQKEVEEVLTEIKNVSTDGLNLPEEMEQKLAGIMTEIGQTLDKNKPEELEYIRVIGNLLGKFQPKLAIKFKEIYKGTTRFSKSEIWAKYPLKYNFITNPSYEAQTQSQLDLVVSGNGQNIVMVECGAKIIPESIIGEGFDLACDKLQILTDFQSEFIQKYQQN
jgi:8-oxo-dGTP pyrophosphatase MutT (NUDIX family)